MITDAMLFLTRALSAPKEFTCQVDEELLLLLTSWRLSLLLRIGPMSQEADATESSIRSKFNMILEAMWLKTSLLAA